MADAVIDVRELKRIYRVGDTEVRALDGVDLRIGPGDFVAIMGSSGSGKSTLMNMLGCLDRPSSGKYFLENVETSTLSEPELARIRSERIGFVFQSFNLLARTSALENVALPLFYSPSGPPGAGQRFARAREKLQFLGLAGRERSSPGQLSGGQQQRVAIARALINDPAILLADEPTGNLDTKTSHEIMDILITLNRTEGVTIVLVTHEPDIAAYADRVLTMRDGKIVSDTLNPKSDGRQRRCVPPAPATDQSSASQFRYGIMIAGAAAQAIARNTMRSILTMLGVFIGVAALIAMVAVGQGANDAVRKQIESLGTNLLVVMPGATTVSGVRAGSGSASTLTVADAQAIRKESSAVSLVSYNIRQLGQIVNGNQNWTTTIQGVTPNYLITSNWSIEEGRGFSRVDEDNAAMVCLIGQTVFHQLFGSYENPVGAVILIKGAPLRVIGLLAGKGQSSYGQDQDDLVMIPFTTAERKVLGVAAPSQSQSPVSAAYPAPPNPYGLAPRLTGYVNAIYAEAANPDLVSEAVGQITSVLARRHQIQPGSPYDFAVRNLSQIAETASSSSEIMALLLATVASISLLVGGIGIMNILLVSVTERTREIGLRMAIGARRLQVLLQFLMEAVFLSLSGGIAGVVGGVGVSWLISAVAHWPIQLSFGAIAGGFLFAAMVGVFFGYYPARKAARLNPIEALRYE